MNKKSRQQKKKPLPLWAVAAIAAILFFVFPFPAFDIAWPFGGEPETVSIRHTPFGDDPAIEVTLSASDAAAFLEELHSCRARFVWVGRQSSFNTESYWITMSHSRSGWVQTSLDGHGTISQQEPQLWRGRGTFRIYGGAAELLQICSDRAGPDSRYPGVAFLKEFFAIGKDGRSDKVRLDAPDGVYGAGDPLSLYDGLKAYMTEHGFSEAVMGRSLYRLEYLCKEKGDGWRCWDIEVTPASEPGYYSYRVGLVEDASGDSENLWVTGNYHAGEDGLVDRFYIDLEGILSDQTAE